MKPRFSPEDVCADFAALLKTYRVKTVIGDRFGGEFPREAFRRHGVTYEVADRSKRELLRDALALLNSGNLELLDHDVLIQQIVGLERRSGPSGRTVINHSPGAHDDVANVALGIGAVLSTTQVSAIRGCVW